MKWLVDINFGYFQMQEYQVIEAETEDEAFRTAYEMTVEHASMFGFEQDPEYFGGCHDELGCDINEEWEEGSEEDKYEQYGSVDCSVIPYIESEHRDLHL